MISLLVSPLRVPRFLPCDRPARPRAASRKRSTLTAAAALFLLALPARAVTYDVSTSSDLAAKLLIVNAGDTIRVANGTYTGTFTAAKSGTSSQPITIKALNQLGATFNNSRFVLSGAFVALEGFNFTGTTPNQGDSWVNGHVYILGNSNRVGRCKFHNGGGGAAVNIKNSSNNRVHHNEITNWNNGGFRITQPTSATTGNRMDHNYLHDYTLSGCSNCPEAIQIGSNANQKDYTLETLVEYNLITNVHLAGELVSLKTSNNTLYANTFDNFTGTVQSRTSNAELFKNNTFLNPSIRNGTGLQLWGDHHEVIGNRLSRVHVYAPAGEAWQPDITHPNSLHPATRYALIAGNTMENGAEIRIGDGTCCETDNYPATDNDALGNTANSVKLTAGRQTGTTVSGTWGGNPGTPVLLTPSEVGPSAPDTAPPTLVGHWKFDETSGTTASDETANNNDGTLTGFTAPYWVGAQVGGGLKFAGDNDIVNAGSGASLDNLPAVTVAAWINATNMGANGLGRIVQKGTGVNPTAGWRLHLKGTNQLEFDADYTTTDAQRISVSGAFSTGTWVHVAATWNGSSTASNIHIYVNGAEVSYATTNNGVGTHDADGATNLYIGNESGGTRGFNGTIDDVRVYNGVLSASDIQALYQAGQSFPAAPSALSATPIAYNQINLAWTDNASNETGFKIERKKGAGGTYAQIATVNAGVASYNDTTCGTGTNYYYRVRAYNATGNSAYTNEANATTVEVADRRGHWRLDETSGTTAADSSLNGNTGTLGASPANPAWASGIIGNALSFDATDDYVNTGHGASLDDLPAITVSAWIKPTSMGENSKGRIVHKGSAAGWYFHLDGTNALAFGVIHAGTNLYRPSANSVVTVGGSAPWQHVAVTWTGSSTATTVKFYVNGVEVAYGTGVNGENGRSLEGTADDLFIGDNSAHNRTFGGLIDDVRVYNRVVSTAELTAIYRAGL